MASYTHGQAPEEDEYPDAGALSDSDHLPQTTAPYRTAQDVNESLAPQLDNTAVNSGYDMFQTPYRASKVAGPTAKRPRPDSGETWSPRQQVVEWVQHKASPMQVYLILAFIEGFGTGGADASHSQYNPAGRSNDLRGMVSASNQQSMTTENHTSLQSSSAFPADFVPYPDLQVDHNVDLASDMPSVSSNHDMSIPIPAPVEKLGPPSQIPSQQHVLSFSQQANSCPPAVGTSLWSEDMRSSRQDFKHASIQSTSSWTSSRSDMSLNPKYLSTTTVGSDFSSSSRRAPPTGTKGPPLAFSRPSVSSIKKEDTARSSSVKCTIPGCNTLLSRESDRKRHLDTMHRDLVYICPESHGGCHFQCRRSDKTREHLTKSHNWSNGEIDAIDFESWRQTGKPQRSRGVNKAFAIVLGAGNRARTRDIEQEEDCIADLRREVTRTSLKVDHSGEGRQLSNDDSNAGEESDAEAEAEDELF